MPDPTALFEPVEGGGWQPTAWSLGPWAPDALHGGPARVVRPGRKIQIVDSEVAMVDGTVVASARLLRIRSAEIEAPDTTAGLPVPPFPTDAASTAELQPSSASWDGAGVALAESRLWDESGLLGRSLQSLLVDRRS